MGWQHHTGISSTVVQDVFNEIEIPSRCTLAKVGSSEWTTTVNSMEENSKLLQSLDGKSHFSALYGMYKVTLTELKAMSAQATHSGSVNKTSSESKVQDDDFHEVKKHKRHNSDDTSW
jgi:hypothetical protein